MANGLDAHSFITERARLVGGTSLHMAQVHTASAQNVQDQPGALRFARLKCTRLKHRTCKTRRGTSLRSWFQKNCLLPGGISIFFSKIYDFENSSWIFFHLKNFLKFFGQIRRIIATETNYDRSFKKFAELFFSQNTPDFET